ncbi:unnamed protein product [Lampetra fluviatilis]
MEQDWMSEEEIEALQDIWEKVFKSAEDVGVIILVRLFTGHPASKQYFAMFKDLETADDLKASAKLRWHAGRVMGSLDKAVRSLRNPEELIQILRAVGLSHARQATPVDVKYYHILGGIIMDVLLETFKDEMSPTARGAWTKLLATLCTEFENAYREEGVLEQAAA